jgi:hypothetical protein
MYPPLELKPEDLKYENFTWQTEYRPTNKEDVFIWKKEVSIVDKVKKGN